MSSKPKKKGRKGHSEKEEKDAKLKTFFEAQYIEGLRDPGLVMDKTGYGYRAMDLKNKKMDMLNPVILTFKNIIKIDFQDNSIQDFQLLGQLPFLVTLNLKKNGVRDLRALNHDDYFPHLQNINLQDNKITELLPIRAPRLMRLNLAENRIDKAEQFDGHSKLEFLDLTKNKLTTTASFGSMPELRELYLGHNKIKVVSGMEGNTNLKVLHLRHNLIDEFESIPYMENLEYFNVRDNKLLKFEDIQKLSDLKNLKALIISENYIIEKMGQSYFHECIIALPQLQRLNKFEITRDLRYKSFLYTKEKYEIEQERLRQEAEKEEQDQGQNFDGYN